jgi:hypothetical protein
LFKATTIDVQVLGLVQLRVLSGQAVINTVSHQYTTESSVVIVHQSSVSELSPIQTVNSLQPVALLTTILMIGFEYSLQKL